MGHEDLSTILPFASLRIARCLQASPSFVAGWISPPPPPPSPLAHPRKRTSGWGLFVMCYQSLLKQETLTEHFVNSIDPHCRNLSTCVDGPPPPQS